MVGKKAIKKEVDAIAKDANKKASLFLKNFIKNIKKFNICDFKIGKTEILISKHGKITIYIMMVLCFLSLLCTGVGFLTTTLMFCVLFTLWFCRDPERVIPDKKNIIVSPCDGMVISIDKTKLPEELNSEDKDNYTKISVLLKITDVHIQRIPVDGIVKQVEYIKGAFINASFDKASKDNERNIVLLERKNGDKICITQIAGLISRRIICDVKQDEICQIGERYGMIKFGSRVEIYLPNGYTVEVLEGQRLVGGETVVATFEK